MQSSTPYLFSYQIVMGRTSCETNNCPFSRFWWVMSKCLKRLVSLSKGREYAVACMRNGRLTDRVGLGEFGTCYVPRIVSHSIPWTFAVLPPSIFVIQQSGEINYIFYTLYYITPIHFIDISFTQAQMYICTYIFVCDICPFSVATSF